MTSAQVVETSVTNNSSFQNYSHLHDHTIRTTDTPGFKPFTIWDIDATNSVHNVTNQNNDSMTQTSGNGMHHISRKKFMTCAVEPFLGNTSSSQITVNVLVGCRFLTRSFCPINIQRRKNGIQLKVVPFYFFLYRRVSGRNTYFFLFCCPPREQALISINRNGKIRDLPSSFLANEGPEA